MALKHGYKIVADEAKKNEDTWRNLVLALLLDDSGEAEKIDWFLELIREKEDLRNALSVNFGDIVDRVLRSAAGSDETDNVGKNAVQSIREAFPVVDDAQILAKWIREGDEKTDSKRVWSKQLGKYIQDSKSLFG